MPLTLQLPTKRQLAKDPNGINFPLKLITLTGDKTLSLNDSGSIITNLGMGAAATATLPTAKLPISRGTASYFFVFFVSVAQELRIDPGSSGAFYVAGAKQTDDKYISADAIGEWAWCFSNNARDWYFAVGSGTWTVES